MRATLAALLLAAVASSCKQPDPPPVGDAWKDDFERNTVGANYVATADVYRLKDGALSVIKGYNHPLWLRKKLPPDAEIEVDVWVNSDGGDLKLEAWGDGESFAQDRGAYTASGYVFIMGGWGNTKSLIARGNEHGTDVVSRAEPKVVKGKKYHWKIVRKGGHIDWFVDDMATPFLSYDDPRPFVGPGHEYLGFNNWESDLWFDNLSIKKLP